MKICKTSGNKIIPLTYVPCFAIQPTVSNLFRQIFTEITEMQNPRPQQLQIPNSGCLFDLTKKSIINVSITKLAIFKRHNLWDFYFHIVIWIVHINFYIFKYILISCLPLRSTQIQFDLQICPVKQEKRQEEQELWSS